MEIVTILAPIIPFLYTLGQTLGVGSSTFALIFFVIAMRDGVIDASEKRFMHAVYFVLRIGMAFILLALLLSLFFKIPFAGIYLMQWIFFGIIVVNAILMTMRKMPMQYGPVIAGGTWYSLFLITNVSPLATFATISLLMLYVAFLIIFYLVFTFIKNHFALAKNAVPPSPTPAS